jgi:hypothetical protein
MGSILPHAADTLSRESDTAADTRIGCVGVDALGPVPPGGGDD